MSEGRKEIVCGRQNKLPVCANKQRFFPLTFIRAANGLKRTSCVIPNIGSETKTSCTCHSRGTVPAVWTRMTSASPVRSAMVRASGVLLSLLLLLTAVSAGFAGEVSWSRNGRFISVSTETGSSFYPHNCNIVLPSTVTYFKSPNILGLSTKNVHMVYTCFLMYAIRRAHFIIYVITVKC
jgi:hypothetical protein